jgi:hypothetical protein
MTITLTRIRQPTEQKEENSDRRDSYVTGEWGVQASSFLVHGVRVLPERQAASSISFLIYFKGIRPHGLFETGLAVPYCASLIGGI